MNAPDVRRPLSRKLHQNSNKNAMDVIKMPKHVDNINISDRPYSFNNIRDLIRYADIKSPGNITNIVVNALDKNAKYIRDILQTPFGIDLIFISMASETCKASRIA